MKSISHFIQEAMALPLNDRVRLAQSLWESVQPPSESNPENEETDALNLACQRDADLEKGNIEGVTHKDAIETARNSLECE